MNVKLSQSIPGPSTVPRSGGLRAPRVPATRLAGKEQPSQPEPSPEAVARSIVEQARAGGVIR